jgi:hypothetical protein
MAVERVRLKVSPGALVDRRFVLRGIREAMRKAVRKTAAKLERAVAAEAPRDTGALRRSVRVVAGRKPEREGVEMKMLVYGRFQSEGFGGKGKFPPPGVLDGWVRRKLGARTPREVRSLAFLVGRKIARIGGPGRRAKRPNRFIERAVRKAGTDLRAEFRKELRRLRLRKG